MGKVDYSSDPPVRVENMSKFFHVGKNAVYKGSDSAFSAHAEVNRYFH